MVTLPVAACDGGGRPDRRDPVQNTSAITIATIPTTIATSSMTRSGPRIALGGAEPESAEPARP
jgi:hypothetical protein